MEEKSKIRINLSNREFEVEGSEEFIAKYDQTINSFLEKIYLDDQIKNNGSVIKKEVETSENTSTIKTNSAEQVVEEDMSFGEWYNKMPSSAKDVDKILLAGYFAQIQSEDKIFSTRQASNLLVEQGVKLSNSSAFMKSNMTTKKVFKHKGGYRVSETGLAYIKNSLMPQAE